MLDCVLGCLVTVKVYSVTCLQQTFWIFFQRLYTTFNPPRINDEIRGDRYIRVSVTKVASSDYSAEILVYAEGKTGSFSSKLPRQQRNIEAVFITSKIRR